MQAHFVNIALLIPTLQHTVQKKKTSLKNIPVFNSMLDDCNTAAANKAYVSYIASTVT